MRRLVLLLALASALGAATSPPPLTLAIAERPGLELVEQLAKHCGSGLQAEPSAMPLLIGEVSIAFAQVPWEDAIEQIAERLHLELVLGDGLLRVSASASPKLSPRRERRVYDLRLLTAGQRDHPGFDLDLPHDEGAVSYIGPPPGADPVPRVEESEFIEILQKQVAPTTWHREDVSIEEWQGHMVVYQAPAVQEQIARHIAGLEAMAARQIVCRLHRLGALPADTGPVLDAHQWAALAEHLPQPAAVFVARNEQVQNHFSGIQRLVVCDADQQQSLQIPIIQTLATGLSLTLRPTITVAGVRVVAKLCATVACELTTSPVSDAAGQPLVVITTPQVTSDRCNDQREIPTGGAAIYRFGERSYALTTEVLETQGTAAKP